MKQSVLLTLTSVLSLLFLTLHLADDIVRGFEKGGPSNLIAVPVAVLWQYGTLVLAGRRSGYVIVLLTSLLGAYVPYLHFKAAGGVVGRGIATSRSECQALPELARRARFPRFPRARRGPPRTSRQLVPPIHIWNCRASECSISGTPRLGHTRSNRLNS